MDLLQVKCIIHIGYKDNYIILFILGIQRVGILHMPSRVGWYWIHGRGLVVKVGDTQIIEKNPTKKIILSPTKIAQAFLKNGFKTFQNSTLSTYPKFVPPTMHVDVHWLDLL